MSARRTVVRFTGGAIFAAFLAAAGCSADGLSISINGPDDDGGPSTFLPDTGNPMDGGPDSELGEGEAGPLPPKCGNLKVESGEQCDDGNTADNDGCSGTCKLESAFEGDTCPGKAITFSSSGALLEASVTGSTANAFNHYGSACGGGSAKDVVYTFTPTTSGKAIVTLTANYSAIVSARSTCDVSTSESQCADISETTGGKTTMEFPVFAGTPAFVFVDGYGGSTGTFTLDIQITQAACGNGVAELPEACDDGNTVAGDGCSPTCTLEGGGMITQCPGQPFALTGAAGQPRKISFSGNTLTDGASTQNAVGCFYSTGPNIVYALKSDIAGAVKADLVAGYTKVGLHARTDCGDSDFQVGCTQRETPGMATLTFPVKVDEWFYVIVDGNAIGTSKAYGGPFTLDVTVTPGACGNHVLDGNEECDDGNANTGDGCTPSCTLESTPSMDTCPGYALALTPHADGSRTSAITGNTTNLTSNHTACALSGSGPDAVFAVTPDIDGYLTASTTSSFNTSLAIRKFCDEKNPDGGTIPADALYACSYKVVLPDDQTDPWTIQGVGNGPKTIGVPVLANNTYWVVVDGVNSNGNHLGTFELEVAVRPPVCGNGVIEGAETCDDGGTDSNDGCDANCKLEPVTSRSTCNDAEAVTLTETSPGNYSASLARGTTNLLANSNISTSSTLDSTKPCWAPGKNAFFAVTAPAGGVLRATAKSDAFDVVLNFRKPTCALTTAPYVCGNDSGKGGEESITTPVAAGEKVWIVVDGKDAVEMGRFSLDVTLTPSGCGDGFYVPGPDEECDDGNKVAGDGCDPTCKLETLTGIDVCPGRAMTLTASGTQHKGTITLDTSKLNADYSGACGGGSREGVVKVTAPISGFLRARTRGMAGSTLYARTTCNDPGTEMLKSTTSSCTSVVHEEVNVQVTAGTDYFLFVDGLDGAVGVPSLDVIVSP